METLKLDKATAIKIYKKASKEIQQILVATFGESTLTGNVMDRVKTFEDACQEAGVKPGSVYTALDAPDEVAFKKLKLIIKVINEGWVPDWSNINQRKWWPWFNLSSGFGFDDSHDHYANTYTTVGSRLCFENEEKCTYVAKQFIDLYEEFLTIK